MFFSLTDCFISQLMQKCCTELYVPRRKFIVTMASGDFPSAFSIRRNGPANTAEHVLYIQNEQHSPISTIHDVPLFVNPDEFVLRMIVTVPRWTNAKMKVSLLHEWWHCTIESCQPNERHQPGFNHRTFEPNSPRNAQRKTALCSKLLSPSWSYLELWYPSAGNARVHATNVGLRR